MHKPDGITLLPDASVDGFLSTFPLKEIPHLRGSFGKRVALELHVESAGDVAHVPRSVLISCYGQSQGSWLHAICRGIDTSEVKERGPPKTVITERSFSGLCSAADVRPVACALCRELLLRLQKDAHQFERSPSTVIIRWRLGYGSMSSRSSPTPPSLQSYLDRMLCSRPPMLQVFEDQEADPEEEDEECMRSCLEDEQLEEEISCDGLLDIASDGSLQRVTEVAEGRTKKCKTIQQLRSWRVEEDEGESEKIASFLSEWKEADVDEQVQVHQRKEEPKQRNMSPLVPKMQQGGGLVDQAGVSSLESTSDVVLSVPRSIEISTETGTVLPPNPCPNAQGKVHLTSIPNIKSSPLAIRTLKSVHDVVLSVVGTSRISIMEKNGTSSDSGVTSEEVTAKENDLQQVCDAMANTVMNMLHQVLPRQFSVTKLVVGVTNFRAIRSHSLSLPQASILNYVTRGPTANPIHTASSKTSFSSALVNPFGTSSSKISSSANHTSSSNVGMSSSSPQLTLSKHTSSTAYSSNHSIANEKGGDKPDSIYIHPPHQKTQVNPIPQPSTHIHTHDITPIIQHDCPPALVFSSTFVSPRHMNPDVSLKISATRPVTLGSSPLPSHFVCNSREDATTRDSYGRDVQVVDLTIENAGSLRTNSIELKGDKEYMAIEVDTFVVCDKCRQSICVDRIEEHRDYHYALDLQHSDSDLSEKSSAGKGPHQKGTVKRKGDINSIENYFKRR
mmetsp:Transcript_30193/g.48758  ORF Transcript_30193/g.48758 Transcript_30193/m.48758 type:complete len:731 (+) Transcript_30193:575-2767(+)